MGNYKLGKNAYVRQWYAKNITVQRPKATERMKQWRTNNPQKNKESWQASNINKRKHHYHQHFVEAWFIYALDVFGEHKCSSCMEGDLRCLQFDHINGRGNEDRKRKLVGITLYRWIVSNPLDARQKYQLLCANCNWRKRWSNWNERVHWPPIEGSESP